MGWMQGQVQLAYSIRNRKTWTERQERYCHSDQNRTMRVSNQIQSPDQVHHASSGYCYWLHLNQKRMARVMMQVRPRELWRQSHHRKDYQLGWLIQRIDQMRIRQTYQRRE